MRRAFILFLGPLIAGGLCAPAIARRQVGTLPVGTQAFLVCQGSLTAREEERFIVQEPIPIIVETDMEAAARETFNGASDTPEPRLSSLFARHLAGSLGGPANAECHLAESAEAGRSMIEFWQQRIAGGGTSPSQFVSWSPFGPESGPELRQDLKAAATASAQ